jgi:hypothetical protein
MWPEALVVCSAQLTIYLICPNWACVRFLVAYRWAGDVTSNTLGIISNHVTSLDLGRPRTPNASTLSTTYNLCRRWWPSFIVPGSVCRVPPWPNFYTFLAGGTSFTCSFPRSLFHLSPALTSRIRYTWRVVAAFLAQPSWTTILMVASSYLEQGESLEPENMSLAGVRVILLNK